MDVPADLTITINDILRVGYCARGQRRWFNANGLDVEFRTLVKGGSIPASKLLATGDALAERVVAAKLSGQT